MEKLFTAFRTNKLFARYTIMAILLIILAIIAPILTNYDPIEATMKEAFQEPSLTHLFGTDKLGRDCFARVLYGARYSISGVLLLVGVVFTLGTVLGIIAGYFGGKIDAVIMRISDLMISFPGTILAIAIAGIMGGSLINAILALTVVSWTKYARLARSLVLKTKKRDYIDAAIINGGTPIHILWCHITPNILPIIVVTAATDIGTMMLELAGLSFLGFGAQPPTPEWGLMLNEGRQQLQTAPWLMLFPGLAILLTVVVFNLWGDSLRDVLDARQED
jgi:peptide/nickel transport system permease protein